MTWNPDAPLDLLNRASLVYVELCGHAAYCNWLEQELPRVKIYLNFKSSLIFAASTEASGASQPQHAMPPVAATSAARNIAEEMVNALRWYADKKNYELNGEILIDYGERARRMLEKYDADRASHGKT